METSERRALAPAGAIMVAALPARADGVPPQAYQQPSQSCLMTALQMGYLPGRREVAYAATEACMLFDGRRWPRQAGFRLRYLDT